MTRQQRAALGVAALIPFAILVAWHWTYGPLLAMSDYAQYLLHARAILEGRPYTDTGYIYTGYAPFIGPRAYPPGLPLTLVPILAIAGLSASALRALMVASAVAFLVLAGRYFARDGAWTGAAVVLLLGAALELSFATNSVMSDLGFCAFLWGTILVADAPGRWTVRRILAVSVLGLCAVAYRVAGAALVPALLLFTALRYREHRLRPAVPVFAWGAVLLGIHALLPVTGAVGRYMAMNPRFILARVADNAFAYRHAVFEGLLYPFPWNAWNDAYHVAASLLALVGLALWLRAAWRSFLFAFSVAYVAMLLVVPVADARYLWPLYPVLAYALLRGVAAASALVRRGVVAERAPRVALGAAAVLVALAIGSHALAPRPATLLDQPDVRDLFAWLRARHEHQPLRVVFVSSRVLTLETGVPGMGAFRAPTVQAGMSELRRQGITHVILGDAGIAPRRAAWMRMLRDSCPTSFELEYANTTFQVFRFTGAKPAAAGP